MTPRHALAELLTQHAQLRDHIERCELYADELDAGRIALERVVGAVSELRAAFDAHNVYEEQLLRPILRDTSALADLRIEGVVAEHVDEHRAMREGLTGELRATLERMRAHLANEERMWMGLHGGAAEVG